MTPSNGTSPLSSYKEIPLRTWTHFETGAQENSEMAYWFLQAGKSV